MHETLDSTPSTRGKQKHPGKALRVETPGPDLSFLDSHSRRAQAGWAGVARTGGRVSLPLPLLLSATASLGGGQRRAALAVRVGPASWACRRRQ